MTKYFQRGKVSIENPCGDLPGRRV
jgi:hypothetical protein